MNPLPAWGFAELSVPEPTRNAQPEPLFDADYPQRQSRLLLFLRPLLFIPQYAVISALSTVVTATAVASWFAVLFTGRTPWALFDFGAVYLRWLARGVAYMSLLTDVYPPFGDARYPAQFVIAYPARSSRSRAALRLLLAIPSLVVFYLLTYVWLSAVVISWFAILFSGRHPLGLFLFSVGCLRWYLRLLAYLLLLTDHYPPFHLSEVAEPAAAYLGEAQAG